MTEDRRRLGGPPEDSLPDRVMARIWNGWGRLLHKLLGRYYDPSYRLLAASMLGLAFVSVYGIAQGTEGSLQLLGAVGAFTALFGVLAYRQEQRWRA